MPNDRSRSVSLAVVLCAVVASAATLTVRSQHAARTALADRIAARHATATRFLSDYVANVFTRERDLATSTFTGPVSPDAFVTITGQGGYRAAVLLDGAGNALAVEPAAPKVIGQPLASRYAHLRAALAGTATASNVVPSAAKGEPVIGFATPYDTPAGRRVFSGAYLVSSTPLDAFIHNAMSFKSSRVLLVDGNNAVIASSDPSITAGQSLAGAGDWLAVVTAPPGYRRINGERTYTVSAAVEGTPWKLVFTIATAELFAPVSGAVSVLPWAVLIAFTLTAAAALLLARRARRQHAATVAAESLRDSILENTSDAFVGMNADGMITDWNRAASTLLGYPAGEAIDRNLSSLIIPADNRVAHTTALSRFVGTGARALPDRPIAVNALHRDGHEFPVELSVSRVAWQGSWQFHGFLRDSTERQRHERQLRELAMTDPLTGLANRRVAIDRLHQVLARAKRSQKAVAVLYIDIDKFKAINDRHGHSAGDEVLIEAAARMRTTFRTEDTIARLGGDEFAVICEDFTDIAAIDVLAERLKAALAKPYDIAGSELRATASVGIATAAGGDTAEAVLARADGEMYDAKAGLEAWRVVQPTTARTRPISGTDE